VWPLPVTCRNSSSTIAKTFPEDGSLTPRTAIRWWGSAAIAPGGGGCSGMMRMRWRRRLVRRYQRKWPARHRTLKRSGLAPPQPQSTGCPVSPAVLSAAFLKSDIAVAGAALTCVQHRLRGGDETGVGHRRPGPAGVSFGIEVDRGRQVNRCRAFALLALSPSATPCLSEEVFDDNIGERGAVAQPGMSPRRCFRNASTQVLFCPAAASRDFTGTALCSLGHRWLGRCGGCPRCPGGGCVRCYKSAGGAWPGPGALAGPRRRRASAFGTVIARRPVPTFCKRTKP
jgi:hypothetical protein